MHEMSSTRLVVTGVVRWVVERLSVETLDEYIKAERERRMVTPWHSRDCRGLGSIINASPCLIKLFLVGLYDG